MAQTHLNQEIGISSKLLEIGFRIQHSVHTASRLQDEHNVNFIEPRLQPEIPLVGFLYAIYDAHDEKHRNLGAFKKFWNNFTVEEATASLRTNSKKFLHI